MLDLEAIAVSDDDLDTVHCAGYGIYTGKYRLGKPAVFTLAGRWASNEIWHPEQRSHYNNTGRFVLEVPYSATTELVMDILKCGPEVEVLSSESLRDDISERLKKPFQQ